MSMDPTPEWKKFCKIIQSLIKDATKDANYIELANALPEAKPEEDLFRETLREDYELIMSMYNERTDHFKPLINLREKHCRVEYPFP